MIGSTALLVENQLEERGRLGDHRSHEGSRDEVGDFS